MAAHGGTLKIAKPGMGSSSMLIHPKGLRIIDLETTVDDRNSAVGTRRGAITGSTALD